MSTMNISLPESLKSFIDSRIVEGSYGSSSEYVRQLIRMDQDRIGLRKLILDGAASERSEKAMDARYFEGLRGRAVKKRG